MKTNVARTPGIAPSPRGTPAGCPFLADLLGACRPERPPAVRFWLTCWEPVARNARRLSDRLRQVNLGAGLRGAGFADVRVHERTAWLDRERAVWEEAAALDPGDDPALQSLHDEGVRSLATFGLRRRVMATATAPSAH